MVTIAPAIQFVSQRNMLDIAVREMVGNNTPHVLIVRTPEERTEQLITQFGNSSVFFGGGFLISKLMEFAQNKVFKNVVGDGLKWVNLSRAFALYATLGSFMVASPQFRNWFTLKKTGKLNFSEMIGETRSTQSEADRQKLVAKKRKQYVSNIQKTLITGAGLTLGILGLGAMAVRSGRAIPAWMEKTIPVLKGNFLEKVALKDGLFKNLPDVGAVLCWALPTYAGFFFGSRDKYEKLEIGIRFGVFMTSFFLLPNAMRSMIEKPLKNVTTQFFGSGKNLAWLAKFATSSILCSAMPSFVNIALTHWRVMRDKKAGKISADGRPGVVQHPATPQKKDIKPVAGQGGRGSVGVYPFAQPMSVILAQNGVLVPTSPFSRTRRPPLAFQGREGTKPHS